MGYTFEWDPRKAKRNWRKRQISFERGAFLARPVKKPLTRTMLRLAAL